jgi:hypothetical protein
MMMASEAKKTKAEPAPKKEAPAPKKEAAPAEKKEAVPAEKSTPDATPAKAEGGEAAGAAPKNYSRGEGQKPVTQAYKDNWDLIFGKKEPKKETKKIAKKKKR